jgi:PKD repeat protein
MKHRLYVLFLALFVLTGAISAQTLSVSVSGTVRESGTNNPIANHSVYIMFDSLAFPYFGTATTNSNGEYAFNIVGVNPTPSNLWVYVYDCNGTYQGSGPIAYGPNATVFQGVDFLICQNGGGGSLCASNFSSSWVQGTTSANFSDLSSAGSPSSSIVSWAWDFGDGTTSTQQNPSHTYNSLGSYTICLTITTSNGCSDTFCDSLWLGGSSGSCQAFFSFGNSGCNYTFYDSSYTSNGPLTYLWDFGDGSTGTGSSFFGTPHTYASSGNYQVCLTISDSQGCTDTYCQTVTANCGGGGGGGCQAGYYWYPDTSGQYTIILVNTSTGNNLSYLWTFGDGSSSTLANPSHVYNGPGYYQVCVTVSQSAPSGCTSTYCDTLGVLNFTNSVPFSIMVMGGAVSTVQPMDEVVDLHPNPASHSSSLKFTLQQSAEVDIAVVDLQGKTVMQQNLGMCSAGENQFDLDLSRLQAGVYFVRTSTGSHRVVRKLVVQD